MVVQSPHLYISGDSLAKRGDNLDLEDVDDEVAYAYSKLGTESANNVDGEEYTTQFAAGFRM